MQKAANKKRKLSPLFRSEERTAYLFIAIPLIGFLIFTVASFGFSVYSAFTDFNPIRGETRWVGWQNYSRLFSDRSFWQAGFNTLFLLLSIPIGMLFGLFLSLYIDRITRGSKLLRVLYYLPAVSSGVAINIVWRYIFQGEYGLLNQILGTKIWWLGTSNWLIKVAIIIKNVWSSIGITMLLYLAGLNNIPDHLYEAADVDGATTIQQFFYITLPLLKPTTFYLIVTGIINGLQSYVDSSVFAEGHEGARTIVYFIWSKGIDTGNYGLAAAASTVLTLFIATLTFIQFMLLRQGEKRNV